MRLLTSTCESTLLEQSLNFAHKACTEQREVAAIAMASDIAEMATVPEPVPRSPNIEPNNNDRLDAPCMHEVMLNSHTGLAVKYTFLFIQVYVLNLRTFRMLTAKSPSAVAFASSPHLRWKASSLASSSRHALAKERNNTSTSPALLAGRR